MSLTEVICDKDYIPTKGSQGSAGYDFIYRGDEVIIKPQETKLVNLNIKLALPKGTVLFLKTRSSFAKAGIIITGGVIDCDYRGNISVCVLNTTEKDFIIKSDMKICQGVLLNYLDMIFKLTDNFSEETERGEAGFGSTGCYKK